MAMAPYTRRKKRIGAFVWIIILLAVAALLFRPLSKMVKGIFAPAWKLNAVATDNASTLFTSKRALREENRRLSEELAKAKIELIELPLLREENRELKELSGRSADQKFVLAGVITNPGQSLYNTYHIDAGSAEGVTVGAEVFANGNALVGTVSEVGLHRSTVSSLATPGNKVSAVVVDSDITITVTGRGGGDYEVALPREIPFTPGMAVLSQGVDHEIIAIVEKIISDPRDPFQRLLARMPVNMRTVRFVSVKISE